jgi:hypothetical protein
MVFKTAKLDTTAIVITILVTAFIIGLGLLFIATVPHGWIWALAMMLIPGICYLLSPKQYRLNGSHLIIQKVIGKTITIPLQDIKGYIIIENLAKTKITRTFGNGGLFGYYGMFSTAEYGPINCQLTTLKNTVIIDTDLRRYAISPDNTEVFVQMLGTKPDLRRDALRPTAPGRLARPAVLALPIALYLITIVLLLLSYHMLPDRIAVHFDALGNPDRWGSKISYLISGLIPSGVLCVINCGVFFLMRKTSHNPALPTFIVIMLSFVQLFTLYINLDVYWVNRYQQNIAPMPHVLIAFGCVLIVLLFVYYRMVVNQRKQ